MIFLQFVIPFLVALAHKTMTVFNSIEIEKQHTQINIFIPITQTPLKRESQKHSWDSENESISKEILDWKVL